MELETLPTLLAGGAVLGVLFGMVLQYSRFCMAGAVSNLVIMGDYKQLHTYLVALAVALTGVALLNNGGIIQLADAAYTSSNITWLAAIVGGLCFGVGTMLSGGCVGRMVIRTSEGDLGALLVLFIIGAAGAASMFGILHPLYSTVLSNGRYALLTETGTLSAISGIPNSLLIIFFVGVTALFIRRTVNKWQIHYILYTGIALGLLITLGWWITGYLAQGFDSTHRPTSITYAGPMVSMSLLLTSGSQLTDIAYFGVMLLTGTLAGSFMIAAMRGKFHWVLPDKQHIPNIIIGGIMMGFGAMLAGGCNLGQGLTGLSTLSLKSIIAVLAIFSGMRIGLWWLSITEAEEESILRRFTATVRGSFYAHR